ncbi:cell division protein PerM [Cellulomonas sp. URHB0016]
MSGHGPRTGSSPVVQRARRRVLSDDVPSRPQFFVSAIDGAPGWATGALAAVQAAVLSLLALVLPSVAAYVATSADPSNEGVGWWRSVGVGASVWLLGHGMPVHVGGVTVTLVPLGISLLAVFTCYASARRSGVATRSGFAGGVLAYLAVVLAVALLVGGPPASLLRALTGATAIAGTGLGAGLLRRPEAPSWRQLSRPVWTRVAAPVRVGAAAGLLALALLVLTAALVTTLWVVAGRATIGDVVRGLGLDAVGGVVLAVAELALVPNLVVWALAWVAGPGFSVGSGTSFAPDGVVAAPLPALPMLGALPAPDVVGPATVGAPAVLVLVGVLAGWYVHRRTVDGRWWSSAASVGVLAGVVAAGAALLVTLASGGAGPDRMAQVGAQGWLVGLAAAAGVLAGALVVALPSDRALRRRLAAGLRSASGRPPVPENLSGEQTGPADQGRDRSSSDTRQSSMS